MNTQRLRAIVEHSPDLVLVLSPEGVIEYAGASVQPILGNSAEAVVGRLLEEFVHPEDLELAQRFMAHARTEPADRVRQVLRLQAADGHWLHIENLASNRLSDPHLGGILVNGRDVTERVALEQKLNYEALHDALTGLANRILFRDRVGQALSSPCGESESIAVMLLDLDRFKSINDTLGHDAGDELLKAVAERLRSATRGSDTVARLGGDEFAVLLTGLRGGEDVLPVLHRVEAALERPVRIRGREIVPSGSIGVVVATEESDVTELMRHADVAMYVAKEKNRGASSCFFEPHMQVAVDQRAQLEIDLRRAVENDELRLVYQPLIELATGRAFGVEALVRWSHPEHGLIGPDRFIPLAEETGLIVALGRWVLHHACRAASEWQRAAAREQPLMLSINVSARQLVADDFLSDVANALASSGLIPDSLILELTESALVEDTPTIMQRLIELRHLGVQLAIDDFGTGYSSLAYLRSFPINILKIDQRFITDLDGEGSSSALAQAVLGLGRTLNLRTVAEGIETEKQLSELRQMGCHFGQGFLFAKPLSALDAQMYMEHK